VKENYLLNKELQKYKVENKRLTE